MKKHIKMIFLVSLVGIFIAGSAMGATMNVRPFGSVASLSELQTAVFDVIGATSIDAYNDQSPVAIFEPTGAGNASAAYIATISWAPLIDDYIEFGLYEFGDTANRVKIFDSMSLPAVGQSVTIEFDQGLNYVKTYDSGGLIDSTTWFMDFGFYAIAPDFDNTYFFSEDDQNPSGYARFLTYEAESDMVTIGSKGTFNDIGHWYVASELGLYETRQWDTTTADFNDFVVQMESIRPVPEPMTILFLGLGLLGLSLVRRKA